MTLYQLFFLNHSEYGVCPEERGGGGWGRGWKHKAEKKFGVNEKLVLDWKKKKEVLQSMPKIRKMMIVRREPQWPELSKGFMTGKILKFLQIIYHKYAAYTPVNFFPND